MTEEARQIILSKVDDIFEKSAEMVEIAEMVRSGVTVKDGMRYIKEPDHYIGVASGLNKAALMVLKLKEELQGK